EGGDPTTAKVADENGIAELAEIACGPNNSPGRIQPRTMLQMADVLPGGRKDFNEAQTVACHVIVSGRVLLGISDEESAADVLNIERREAVGDSFGFESVFIEMNALETRVVNLDSCRAEIRDVEKFVAVDFAGGCTFVDGAIRVAGIGVIS